MEVDDPVRKPIEKRHGQEVHPPGEHHQIGLAGRYGVGQVGVVAVTGRQMIGSTVYIRAQQAALLGDPCAAGPLASGRFPAVDDHLRHLG